MSKNILVGVDTDGHAYMPGTDTHFGFPKFHLNDLQSKVDQKQSCYVNEVSSSVLNLQNTVKQLLIDKEQLLISVEQTVHTNDEMFNMYLEEIKEHALELKNIDSQEDMVATTILLGQLCEAIKSRGK